MARESDTFPPGLSMEKPKQLIGLVALLMGLACASAPKIFAAEKVGLINVDGAIGPATASYISRSIEEARAQNVQCLVIQLNTPGGLLDSTQKIVQSFLGSPVPVVVYVAPTGATATSAGCFITLAANVAAMAPATTIGAAHPVSIGGFVAGAGGGGGRAVVPLRARPDRREAGIPPPRARRVTPAFRSDQSPRTMFERPSDRWRAA